MENGDISHCAFACHPLWLWMFYGLLEVNNTKVNIYTKHYLNTFF